MGERKMGVSLNCSGGSARKERTMEQISSEEYMSGMINSMESENVRLKRRVNDIEGRVALLEEKVSRLWEMVLKGADDEAD